VDHDRAARWVTLKAPLKLASSPGTDIRAELDRIRSAVARIEQQLAEQDEGVPSNTLGDDAIVDQRSVPAPPDLYLRLARNGAFPSHKLGKRVLARWGDVRRVFLNGPGLRKASTVGVPTPTSEDDGLNALRQRLGLESKGILLEHVGQLVPCTSRGAPGSYLSLWARACT